MTILITKYKTGIDLPPLTTSLNHLSGENSLTFPYKSGDNQDTFSTTAGVHLCLVNGGNLILTDDTDTFTVTFGASNISITWHSRINSLADVDDVVFVFNAFAKPTSGITRLKYVATSGQTVFSGNDANGTALSIQDSSIQVFKNDNFLDESDYTLDLSNNRVTLSGPNAAAAGDIVSMFVFSSIGDQTALDNATTAASDSATAAAASATAAASSAGAVNTGVTAAANSATAAANSATASANSATASANSASTSSGHATTASGHATTAQNYAVKVDGAIPSTSDYSSKAWAVGGTGVDNASGGGAAKDWATDTTNTVDNTEYSAKEYAIGTQSGNTNGSAKQWALGGGNSFSPSTAVSGGLYSAKYWADQAASSVANFDEKYYGNYANDAAAENAHEAAGKTVTVGDLYFNTTLNAVRYCQVAPSGSGSPVGTWQSIAQQDLSGFPTAGFTIAMSIAL